MFYLLTYVHTKKVFPAGLTDLSDFDASLYALPPCPHQFLAFHVLSSEPRLTSITDFLTFLLSFSFPFPQFSICTYHPSKQSSNLKIKVTFDSERKNHLRVASRVTARKVKDQSWRMADSGPTKKKGGGF